MFRESSSNPSPPLHHSPLPPLRIGQHQVPTPIIQGGMGIRISGAHLAAAVANSGGIGIISAVGLGLNSPYFNPDEPNPKIRQEQFFQANQQALVDEVNTARRLSPQGILGINIMMAARDHESLVRTAAEHGINLVIAGAGLPLQLPKYTADHPDIALVPIISSLRAAKIICRKWQQQHHRLPDALIVENPSFAGGHLGASQADLLNPLNPDLQAESVIPAIVDFLDTELKANIPVIAAGGIWERSDIDRMLALGASGVQMGTRFITTHECDADVRYKTFHLQAKPEDVVLVPSPVGLPGRALRNPFVDQVLSGNLETKTPCLANCLHQCKFRDHREGYCIVRALDQAARGNIEEGLIFSGTNAGRADRLMSVAEVMATLNE